MAVNGIDGANYLLTQIGDSYENQKCDQAVVINLIRRCPGGDPNYRTGGCTELWNSIGSSSKYRHITKRMTLAEAKKEGLLIGDLPVIYSEKTGKCEHIAYYMGGIGGYECIHSSEKMKGICGTTLKNGFTHVLRHRDITGVPVSEYEKEVDSMGSDNTLYSVQVRTNEGGALNLRKSASTSSAVLTTIPYGAIVEVIEETSSKWLKVVHNGTTGYVSRPLVVKVGEAVAEAERDSSGGTLRWGVFVICDSESEAQALVNHFDTALVCQREVDD